MKKTTKSLTVLGIVSLLAVSLVAAGGFMWNEEDKEAMQANREAAREAIENNDYDTWASLMQERVQKMQDNINEETFQQIRERHTEMAQFREEMQNLREEYGFEGKGMRKGMHFGHGDCPMAETE